MRSGTLPNDEEPYPCDSRDNDAKREKFVTIGGEESDGPEGISFIKHVSKSHGSDQDAADQADLKNTLDQVFRVHRRENSA